MADENGAAQSGDAAGAQASGGVAAPQAGDDLLNQGTPTGEGEGAQGDGQGEQANAGQEAEGEGEPTGAPDEYGDFSTPEGIAIDEQLLAQANPIFKELGLSQDQAQKLVDFEAKRVQAQVDQYHQQVDGWKEASRGDTEFGGDKFDQSIALANKALEKFFTPAFTEAMRPLGLMNHPEVIRGLARIGRTYLTEDDPGKGDPANPEKSRVERLYGSN